MNLTEFKDVKSRLSTHFRCGNFSAFKKLAEQSGIDLSLAFENDQDPLFLEAVWLGKFQFAEYMLSQGLNIDHAYQRNQRTALTKILMLHDPFPALDFLFHYGADIDAQDRGGLSALMVEIQGRGRLDVVRQLVRYGASPDIRSHYGFDDALGLAQQKGDPVLIHYLQNSKDFLDDRTPNAWQCDEIRSIAVGLRNATCQIDFMKVRPETIPATRVLGVPGLTTAVIGGFFDRYVSCLSARRDLDIPVEKFSETYKGISAFDALHHTGQFAKILKPSLWRGRRDQFERLVRLMPMKYRHTYENDIKISRTQQLLSAQVYKKTPPRFRI